MYKVSIMILTKINNPAPCKIKRQCLKTDGNMHTMTRNTNQNSGKKLKDVDAHAKIERKYNVETAQIMC